MSQVGVWGGELGAVTSFFLNLAAKFFKLLYYIYIYIYYIICIII